MTWRAHCLLTVLLWVAAAWFTSVATAQDSKQLTVDGVRGRWFPMPVAGMLLEEHLALPRYKELLTYQGELLAATNKRLEVSAEKLKLCLNDAAVLQTATYSLRDDLSRESSERRKAEKDTVAERERSRAWFRHPAVWFGAGVLLTSATVLTLEKVYDND